VIHGNKCQGNAKLAMANILAVLNDESLSVVASSSSPSSSSQQQSEQINSTSAAAPLLENVSFSALNGRMGYQTLSCAANQRDKLFKLPAANNAINVVMSADSSTLLLDVKEEEAKDLCKEAIEKGNFLLVPFIGDVPKLANMDGRRGPSGYRVNFESRGYNGSSMRNGGNGNGSGRQYNNYRGGGGGGGGGRFGGSRNSFPSSRNNEEFSADNNNGRRTGGNRGFR
jgi:uncharacterized membrane protein YgcG